MPTQTKENYLKALYHLHLKDAAISLSELSKELEVSKSSVNDMVKKLQKENWVDYERYKPLKLTEKGRQMASLVVRKHRLTEMFLQKIMGFGWEEVHEIAEQMEHIQSEKLFARMDEMLNYPTVDPHGSPIPNEKGSITEQQYEVLADIDVGQKVQLCALAESSNALLHYLNQTNIKLGTIIDLLKVEPFDKSLVISCNGSDPLVISDKVAKSLFVKRSLPQ